MGFFVGFGDNAFIADQKILAFKVVEMLLKELSKDFRPWNDSVEEALHCPIAAAFSRPSRDTQHRHPAGHAQHRLYDPAHVVHIRFRQIGLYTL